jgi:hypothetical protein
VVDRQQRVDLKFTKEITTGIAGSTPTSSSSCEDSNSDAAVTPTT